MLHIHNCCCIYKIVIGFNNSQLGRMNKVVIMMENGIYLHIQPSLTFEYTNTMKIIETVYTRVALR